MTYGEAKERIRDLGFEENSSMTEYKTIVKNALNTAIQEIYDDIVTQLRGYYKKELSTPEMPWIPKRPAYITDDTEDDFVIELPENLLVLVPLLAGHFVWLDDDIQKAMACWNDYEDFRERIVGSCLSNIKAVIMGGVNY